MEPSILYLPKKGHTPQHAGRLVWRIDNGPETYAERTSFGLGEFPPGSGQRYWVFSGSTGTPEQENYFYFQIIIDYQRGPFENITLKLGDHKLLSMGHTYSIPAPEGFYGVQTVAADAGETTLSLDLETGTIDGRFESVYRALRLAPKGHFRMTRDNLQV
ncbi:MAG: hypothetical protein WCA48_14370 [Pseudomonas gingeri]